MKNIISNHEDIVITKLSKAFGHRCILNELSLTIAGGCTTALMASSGSGKTTLLRILMGLDTADCGSIHGLNGKRISCVFQEDRLCDNLSPVSNVRLTCTYSKKEISALLINLGLKDCLSQPVRTLSGGEKRRTALARALLSDYDFILLDEPFKGLDSQAHKLAMQQTALYTAGKTMLMATHNIEEASFFSANIVKL